MLDAQFIQIKGFLYVVLCGRGKTGGNSLKEERDVQAQA